MDRIVVRLRRPVRHTALLLDATVSLAVFVMVAAPLVGTAGDGARPAGPWAYLLAAALAVPYVAHRRWPLPALGASSLALVVYSTGHYEGYPGFAAFAMVLGLALHAPRRVSAIGYAVSLVALSLGLALQPSELVDASSWFTSLLVLTVVWLAGENLRARRTRWSALQERARRLEVEREERARQAVEEERMRIARELHDVVAHSMSVIAVQAGVAHHVIDARPELAKEALGTIETTSRSALVELRRMLGLLRRHGDTAESLAPAPGLEDLAALGTGFADAGLTVTIDMTGETGLVPRGVQLSAYRIVQESLTNALKHGGASATVHVASSADGVVVEVSDPGTRGRPTASVAGAGQGLVGMRERVALFNGVLDAGPDPAGGYRVHAELPSGGGPTSGTAPRTTTTAAPS